MGRAKTNKEEIRSGLDAILTIETTNVRKERQSWKVVLLRKRFLEIPELKHLVNIPENKDEYQSLNYIGIIAHLVSAVQELN